VIVIQKNDVSYQNEWLPPKKKTKKKCDTNKNVIKIGLIINGFYLYLELAKLKN